jgi:tetratricopeptide (TPR) repeat protein
MKTRLLLLALILAAGLPALANDSRVEPIQAAVDASEWKEAFELAEEWVSDEPENPEAHYWLAISLRVKMELVSKIRAMASVDNYTEAMERAIALDPKHIDARQEHIGYLIHAPGIAGGDRDQAREEIEALEKIDPVAALQMRLELFRKEEDREGQTATLKALQALEPENALYGLQEAGLLVAVEHYDKAEPLLLEAQDSDDLGVALAARYQRARWRVIANREIPVARDLLLAYLDDRGNAALTYAPSRAAAYWRLGLAYEGLGDKEAAIEALEESVHLEPDFKLAAKDLKRLKRGR